MFAMQYAPSISELVTLYSSKVEVQTSSAKHWKMYLYIISFVYCVYFSYCRSWGSRGDELDCSVDRHLTGCSVRLYTSYPTSCNNWGLPIEEFTLGRDLSQTTPQWFIDSLFSEENRCQHLTSSQPRTLAVIYSQLVTAGMTTCGYLETKYHKKVRWAKR